MYTILADDFTGANDTGIQFIDRHDRPLVLLDPSIDEIQEHSNLDVLILDTESRHLDKDSAYEKISSYAPSLRQRKKDRIFKKVDSTLRGNVGAEIDALMDTLGYSLSFVIPAAPENGRIVKNGECIVNGEKLHSSEFGKDLLGPISTSFVPDIIRKQTNRKVVLVPYQVVRKDKIVVQTHIEELIRKKNEIIVFDSINSSDIEKVVAISTMLKKKILFVGSSGLGKVFGNNSAEKNKSNYDISSKVLFVFGSQKNISSVQIDCLQKSEHAIGCIDIFADELIADNIKEVLRVCSLVETLSNTNEHIVLRTIPEAAVSHAADEQFTKVQLKEIKTRAQLVGCSIGAIAKEAVIGSGFRTVFITGGDTAAHFVNSLGVNAIELLHEIEPGIPLCKAKVKDHGMNLHVITKAGGFGEKNTLIKILDFIIKRGSSR